MLTSLTLVWVYGLTRVWGRADQSSAPAAAVMGFSWEFSYHVRWVAQDAMLTQFTALSLSLASVGRFRAIHHADGSSPPRWPPAWVPE